MAATRPQKPITRQEIKRLIRSRANTSGGSSSGSGSSSGGSSSGTNSLIVAGVGLDGGGTAGVDATITIDLADTAVTPGTYGDASNVPQITVDQQGRLTAVTEVGIAGSSLEVQDEGATEEDPVTIINFTGAGVTATGDGMGTVEVNIPGASGAAWWFQPPDTTSLATAVTDGTFTAGPTVTDDADAGMILTGTVDAADEAYLRLTTAPSLPFTAICRVQVLSRADGHYSLGGVVLRESSSGRKVVFGSSSNSRWIGRWSNGTTGIGETLGGDGTATLTTDLNAWFRVDCDASSNLTFYIGPDGKSWASVGTVSAATVGWSAVNQVGVGITARANSGLAMIGTFEYFDAS